MNKLTKVVDREHEKLRLQLLLVIKTKAADWPADQILALVAYLLGQLIAMQDQLNFTSYHVMQMVSANIEAGNREVIETLMKAQSAQA